MKAFKAIISAVVLLIPTILAVVFYQYAQKNPVVVKAVEKLEIVDTAGNTLSYNKGNDADESVIKLLVEFNNTGEAVESLPADIKETTPFSATFYSYGKKSAYQYYISKDPEKGYIVDGSNKVYKAPANQAQSFACQNFAASLYGGSRNPELTVAGVAVVPTDYEWKYQLINGEYTNVSAQTTKEMRTYKVRANMEMTFSNVAPGEKNCRVKITDGSDILFDDYYENLVNMQPLSENKTLSFHVEAKWYETNGSEGQGSAAYDFLGEVSQPATFTMSMAGTANEEAFVPGDFVVITAKNVAADATITFASSPDIGYTPVFVPDGAYYRALVPIRADLPGGAYTFTIGSDGVTQDLTLSVSNKTFRTQNYSIAQSIVSATRTDATLQEFNNTMSSVATSLEVPSGVLYSGTFSEGVPAATEVQTGFGILRNINGVTSYSHQGVDYRVNDGTKITAVNNGKVIFVGSTTLSGTTVVVEHGLGLKSWYCHLSSASVNVGDTVTQGQSVGVAGSTGFCEGTWAHIGMSVFNVPVSPYRLWDYTLDLPNP